MGQNSIDALIVDGHENAGTPALRFGYRNHRGEYAARTAYPLRVAFGSTVWHPKPQWLLHAYDVERKAVRSFAMDDMMPLGIRPLSRDELREALASLSTLKQALDALPHREFVAVDRLIGEVHDAIAETLPGGFAGYCEASGEALGHDEVALTDADGNIFGAEAAAAIRAEREAGEKVAAAESGGALELVHGAMYRARNGNRIGPMALTSGAHVMRVTHPFTCFGRTYTRSGRYFGDYMDSPHDLIAEA